MQIDKNKQYLFLTRGIPGSGKSTFIKKYLSFCQIVEPDAIRLKINGIVETKKDGLQISQANPDKVWGIANQTIQENLKNGKSVVLDATNLGNYLLHNYKKIAEDNKVNFVIIDFTNIPLDVCKKRNSERLPAYKRVPEEVILRMYKKLEYPLADDLVKHVITSQKLEEQFTEPSYPELYFGNRYLFDAHSRDAR